MSEEMLDICRKLELEPTLDNIHSLHNIIHRAERKFRDEMAEPKPEVFSTVITYKGAK
jgi:hypothetical protein